MIREMKKRSETYKKYNFIDVIYSLVDAYKRSRKYPDKNKVRSLTPIKGAYSGYFLNKVEFEDPIPHTDSLTMTRVFNDSLSRRIITNPEQWYWMLRRWDGA